MKYLKTYESIYVYDKRWKVPLHIPEFFICLKKAGMTDNELIKWMRLYNGNVFKDNQYISLEKYNGADPDNTFLWSPAQRHLFSNDDSKYMGELIATPEEVQEWNDNIEMKKNVEKYNL